MRLMRTIWMTALLICLASSARAQVGDLRRSTPEQQGVPSQRILNLLDSITAQPYTQLHNIIIMRHGQVIAEKAVTPYRPEYGHTLYSCSKTFTAAAVGLAIEDSLLTLDDHLIDFFPEDLPDSISEDLASITVQQLLTMTSGLPVDTEMRTFTQRWIQAYLAKTVRYTPGSHFAYDSISTYLLSAIVQQVTGQTVMQLLDRRVFQYMHINKVAWEESPEGITCGGWGLWLQCESMAKFGQLLLNRGQWAGDQLLPAEWVDQMMTSHVAMRGDDYGFQMWACENGDVIEGFRADGAYGQYIYVLPRYDMVIAITQALRSNSGHQRQLIYRELLPYVQDEVLPQSPAYLSLKEKTYSLPFPAQGWFSSSKHLAPITVQLDDNSMGWRTVTITPGKRTLSIKITDTAGRTYTVNYGYQKWEKSTFSGAYPVNARPFQNCFSNIPMPFTTAGSYSWVSDTDLRTRLHYVTWLTSVYLRWQFSTSGVNITIVNNYTSGSTTIRGKIIRTPIKGKR